METTAAWFLYKDTRLNRENPLIAQDTFFNPITVEKALMAAKQIKIDNTAGSDNFASNGQCTI